MAILNDDVRRTGSRPMLTLTAIAVAALAVAAARPSASVPRPDVVPPSAAAVPDVAVGPPAPAQKESVSWEGCTTLSGNFRGRTSNSDVGGRTVIHEQIGTSGADRIIFKTIGDLDLCMVTTGVSDESLQPSDWPGRGARTTLQTRRGGVVHRLETTRASNGAQRVVWMVNGAERAFDAAAQDWRERALAVADTTWELANVRGEQSALRGQVSAVRGEESALRGEISALRGQVSAMRGEISAVHGEESSLRGEISAIQGHVSSLQGAISAERGTISALNASRYGLSDRERQSLLDETRKREEAIARIEREIRDYKAQERIAAVETQIRALDARAKAAAIESDIRKFDVEAKIAEVEKRILDLNVTSKTNKLENAIVALDADGRSRKLEAQIADEIKRLIESVARIR